MFDYKYLSREHLEGFDNYKYMAIDTSPLSVYIMHPFWNKVVELVPRWVAPNLLTFSGFLLTVLDFLILSVFDYNYTMATSANITSSDSTNGHKVILPNCVWIMLAVFLFLAYTLDGIDGKQARRTQTSGPLGELFDHGLDSYSVVFIPACIYSIFGRSDYSVTPIRMYFMIWNILLNFYFSHWEKYNTGVLFLPWGYDFSMLSSTLFFFLAGLKGTDFFKMYLFSTFSLGNAFEVLVYGTGLTNMPVGLFNTYQSYKLRTGKMRSLPEAIRPLWSLATIFTALTVWVLYSPNQIIEYDPRAVYLLMGTIFSNLSCRLIVCQMSNQRCESTNLLLLPLCMAVWTSLWYPRLELISLYMLTLLSIATHIHYGTCVVRQMCDHFRVQCFQIKKRTD